MGSNFSRADKTSEKQAPLLETLPAVAALYLPTSTPLHPYLKISHWRQFTVQSPLEIKGIQANKQQGL